MFRLVIFYIVSLYVTCIFLYVVDPFLELSHALPKSAHHLWEFLSPEQQQGHTTDK